MVLKTSPASICTGTTQPETCTDTTNSKLPMGAITFYVAANFVDNSGNAGVTPVDDSSAVTIAAPTPTALKVIAQ